ncbi:MAG: hypothetical protein A3H98_00400 [Bacteroidetes bacterium RIFCSPLOWO2_02_FULL_36_8]|nr:MAG: hypothetical protein A3H98_00400 [Bacteroidetes bacterium RIFCSPLOWO2_02_FULL_36_8]OFY71099.1 MAG: hypothetical protein A3G23_14920 [Bacteroidetes bacterium RIFCSPLOWO2_12_FULL_37_12]
MKCTHFIRQLTNRQLPVLILLFSAVIPVPAQETSPIRLFHFSSSDCDENYNAYRQKNKILSKKKIKDTLSVSIQMAAACCLDFEGSVDVRNQIINFVLDEKGSPCRCVCCYQFYFRLANTRAENYYFLLNGKEISESNIYYKKFRVKFDILDGDTLNFVDNMGYFQGKWKNYNSKNQLIQEGVYVKNVFTGTRTTEYHDNGNKKTETLWKADYCNKTIEYFESGKIKSEILFNKKFKLHGECKEFDEQGNVTQVKVFENGVQLK